MKCPSCHLENPPTAIVCDCGFNFAANRASENQVTGSLGEIHNDLRAIYRKLDHIFTLGIIWFILMLFGTVVLTITWSTEIKTLVTPR